MEEEVKSHHKEANKSSMWDHLQDSRGWVSATIQGLGTIKKRKRKKSTVLDRKQDLRDITKCNMCGVFGARSK